LTIFWREYFTNRYTNLPPWVLDPQLKLVDVDSVELLDKRGYLTICLTLVKEGKIYLRRPEGIRDWYNSLQVNPLRTSANKRHF
jgi:hypothetical protein